MKARAIRWENVQTGDRVTVVTRDQGVLLERTGTVGEQGVTSGGLRYWKTREGGILAIGPDKAQNVILHKAAPAEQEKLF